MQKIPKTWITAYDVFSAQVAEKCGVDTLLVGDSLGMTVYGFEDTTSVTREMMAEHFKAVKRGAPNTRIVLDFPFGCDSDALTAVETAEFFANAGAEIFKIEGGLEMLEIFLELRSRGYEIVGHLGLTPQKIQKKHWGVQGREKSEAKEISQAVKKFAAIGIKEVVLECVPEPLATKIQSEFSGDIIGIGAGRNCNAQVLVFDDVVGKTPEIFAPKFLRKFGSARQNAEISVQKFLESVRKKTFPAEENIFL